MRRQRFSRSLGLVGRIFGILLLTVLLQSRALAPYAALLLGGSVAAFAALALAALWRGSGERVVRDGIGMAVLALLATVALGVLLLAARSGWLTPVAPELVDLHAVFGGVGWMLGLLAAVAGVTLPMLQGTRAVPTRVLRGWQAGLLLALGQLRALSALAGQRLARLLVLHGGLGAGLAPFVGQCGGH